MLKSINLNIKYYNILQLRSHNDALQSEISLLQRKHL